MRKHVVEFIGTFIFVLTIGLTAVGGLAGALAPLAIGAALMAMIYAGGHISGAHYNPAVTLAVWLRGRCPAADALPYVAAQLLAAALAALCAGALGVAAPAQPMVHSVGKSLLAEFLFTFALVWVVLNVATAKGTAGKSFYGAAIAMLLVAGILAVGGVSGAVFNPAVALGITLLGASAWGDIWIYLAANFSAAAAAAGAFRALCAERE